MPQNPVKLKGYPYHKTQAGKRKGAKEKIMKIILCPV